MLFFNVITRFYSIQEIYDSVLEQVLGERIVPIGCPKCGMKAMNFTIHGQYERNVVDLRPLLDENNNPILDEHGNIIFEDYQGEENRIKMNITRIKCKEDGTTHALLFQLFVPYAQYSLRYIVYHLYQWSKSGTSVEAYCDAHNLSVVNVRKWMKYLEESVPMLQQVGLIPETEQMDESVQDKETTTKPTSEHTEPKASFLRTVSQWIYQHFEEFYRAVLLYIRRVMFQVHMSPPNTVHQFAQN